MDSKPHAFEISLLTGLPNRFDNHLKRSLSSMKGQYADETAYNAMLSRRDTLVYEVYDFERPHVAGELLYGISIIHPGKVGDEYFMTKGHFHSVLDTAEFYYCLKGQGMMVMETPEGEWSVQPFYSGSGLYVLPRWAHRSVNTSLDEDLVLAFVYPGHAGHDYGSIEQQGFRKLVVERDNRPQIIDNLRWLPPEARR